VTSPYTAVVPPMGADLPDGLPDGLADALANLHTRTVDALAGYETMVDKAEPSFRPVATRFRDIHARHAATLAPMLVRAGRVPDTDGSFMASVNRAVVGIRAFFDAIDADVTSQIRSGEQHVLAAFDDAIAASPLGDNADLTDMRAELQAALDATPDLT
jgi:Domain of unknown function (DUF2383)